MSTDSTERDLRDLLARESWDVATSDQFLVRLGSASRARHRPSAWWAAAAAAVIVLLLTIGSLAAWQRASRSGRPAAATGLHTPHLALRLVPQFRVTAAEDLGDREVLQVSYSPTARSSYDGGAVTLYDPGVFRPVTFLPTSVAVRAAGHHAHAGSYPFTGVSGSVTTLAWETGNGRWVSVQNFNGTNYPDGSSTRALEVRVAAAVIVR